MEVHQKKTSGVLIFASHMLSSYEGGALDHHALYQQYFSVVLKGWVPCHCGASVSCLCTMTSSRRRNGQLMVFEFGVNSS